MKVFGLLDLRALFIFEKYRENFENAINASYKMCEDGADGIVIKGNFRATLDIYSFLRGKVDVPIAVFLKTKRQYDLANNSLIINIFSNESFPGTIKTVYPVDKTFLKKKVSDAVLLPNVRLLHLLRDVEDSIPELTALVSYKLARLRYDYMITPELISAKKGLKFFRKYH